MINNFQEATIAADRYLKNANLQADVRQRITQIVAIALVECKERIASADQRAEQAEQRLTAVEAALQAITRRGPIMGSTGEYRRGQLDALEACAEVAKAALTTQEGR